MLVFRDLKPEVMLAISLKILSKYLALFPFSEYTFFISLFVCLRFPILPVVHPARSVQVGSRRCKWPGDTDNGWPFTLNRDLN